MRPAILLAMPILLSACVTMRAGDANPDLRVRIADLDLATPAGRAALRHRVRAEAERFCRFYKGDVVIEALTRLDSYYCRVEARNALVREMAVPTREAYRLALVESGGRP